MFNALESADTAFKSGDFAKAAEGYRAALAADASLSSAWRGLGISLIQLGEVSEAVSACRRASELQPASADSHYAYGYALGAEKRFADAIAELDTALTLQPNHGSAKQVLVYALIQLGHQEAETDPRLAESHFERAYRIDHRNPNAAAPLLEHLRKTNQKGKASQMIAKLDPALKDDPSIQPIVQKMHDDPAFHTVLQQSAMGANKVQAKAAAHVSSQTSINFVPCPSCGQSIADYAAICPHCNFRNRATGTFAGRDTGPNYEWQEIAFTIVSVIWLLNAGWSIFAATQMNGMAMDFFLTIGIANAAVGLGLLFKMDLAMLIAKFLCYINLVFASYGVIFGLMMARWGSFASALFTLCLAGFMVYLINYNSDV